MRRCALPLVVVLLLWPGCDRTPELPNTPAELKHEAAAAREQARLGRQGRRAADAGKAADRAQAAARKLKGVVEGNAGSSDAERQMLAETESLAREARKLADLAGEDDRLDQIKSSLKARAYQTARPVLIKATFQGLALAARQAQKTDPQSLNPTVRDAAQCAASVAVFLSAKPVAADGSSDGAFVSSELDRASQQPPPRLGHLVTLAWLLAGRTELALVETGLAGQQQSGPADDRALQCFLRGLALSMNGMPRLGSEELEKIPAITGEDAGKYGPEALGMVHLCLAALALDSREYAEADRQLACAIRAWPDNPVAVYLTGERMNAAGEYEKAADSLEAAAKGCRHERIAKALAQRARAIRDGKGQVGALFTDTSVLREVVLALFLESAGESKVAAMAKQWIEAAGAMGNRLLDNLPSALK